MTTYLQNVFVKNGVPTFTFVEPVEFDSIVVNLRTPGRPMIIEGPSGIGKTTAVLKAIEKSGYSAGFTKLSARRLDDIEYIELIPELAGTGAIIVDDFHKFSSDIRRKIADHAKYLADTQAENSKIILIGINDAGRGLIEFASDLANRVDIIRFEKNPDTKLLELLKKGEEALNITLNIKDDIVKEASGGFYIAQMLAFEACLIAKILERPASPIITEVSFENVKAEVWERLKNTFYPICRKFSRGAKFKSTGLAAYLNVLHWLSTEGPWSLDIKEAVLRHPELKGSVNQIVEKKHLAKFLSADSELSTVFNYDDDAARLVVDDPQFVFFIRNISWSKLAKDIGYRGKSFNKKYDFALSFAGSQREHAKSLFDKLTAAGYKVFYDKNETYRMLAADVEGYLAPIYQSDARYVICLLSKEYPTRIWAKFESEAFSERFSKNEVIPIMIDGYQPDFTSTNWKKAHLSLSQGCEFDKNITEIVDILDHRAQLDLSNEGHD
ncbi:TIR domain-containing protein [Methylobacterium oryzihabitans]|uniref:TIR domain-containing protein n=1 Tax=Methylobacterium oryzihabitans TaxID=2499852 RepID=A0A3S2VF61_9HYPH|nr:TIR domain-containing protein [Methylobacterium oryzihabitans]RVU21542.1 TIR domain-containing protein [Methylobacterium oryzihabitans]